MDEAAERRDALVNELKKNNCLTQVNVEAALRATPRHLFLPDVPLEQAYADEAIATKFQDGVAISSSSQPAIMAIMLEQLGLRQDEHVLEIGAGTGYNAALMRHLVGGRGHVTTLDIDEDTAARARENLVRAGVTGVEVICGDGGFGCAANAPYDAVIATVGVWDLSPHWVEQLAEGGRLVAPLWFHALQFSIGFDKIGGALVSRSLRPCGFMRMRGGFAGPESVVHLGDLTAGLEDAARVKLEALEGLLAAPGREARLVELEVEGNRGLLEYAVLRGEEIISVTDHEKSQVSCGFAFGLLEDGASLALLTFDSDAWRQLSSTVGVYGDDSAVVHLRELAREWEARGRPSLEHATLTAAPLGARPGDGSGFVLRKKWMEYRITF